VALLGLAPAAVLPGGLDRFTLPKAAVACLGATLVLDLPAGPLPRRWRAALAATATLAVGAALLGRAPLLQLLGRAPRFEGVVTATAYLLAFLAGTRVLAPAAAPLGARLLAWWAGAALLVGALALPELGALSWVSPGADRGGSLLGNATELGAYGVLTVGLLGAATTSPVTRPDGTGSPWWRRLVVSGTLGGLVCVVASASRGAALGLLVTGVLLLLAAQGRPARLAVLAGAFGVALVSALAPLARSRLTGASPLAAATVAGRVDLWRAALDLVRHHPLGVGPSGFADAVGSVLPASWYGTQPSALVIDSPHSLPLQVLVAGGPLLLAALGWLAWLWARAAWTVARGPALVPRSAVLAVPGYLVVLLTHFTGPSTTLPAALLAGAALPLATHPARSGGARAGTVARALSSRAARAAAALLALVLAIGATAEIALRSAIASAQHGDPRAAADRFRLAETLRPWDRSDIAAAAVHAYAALARSGDRAAAAQGLTFTGEVSALGSSPVLLGDLGSLRDAAGDLAGADRELTAALALDPHNPDLLLRAGVVAGERGELTLAESRFLEVTRTRPDSPDPWTDLAVLYRLAGRSADAAAAETQAARRR